jgi:hypothetical protein
MMEAVRTSETSVNVEVTTRHYIPEGSTLYKNGLGKDQIVSRIKYGQFLE